MRRMRGRWVLGAPLVLGVLALSCGSGGGDDLFSPPSSNGGGGGSSAGGANHAGAPHVNGGAGGSSEPSGGADPGLEAGATAGGATGQTGGGGSMTSGAGGGGAGGSHAGAGGSHAGAGGSHAGAGGSHAGGGGTPAGGGGAGGAMAGAGGAMAGAGGAMAGAGGAGGATCVDNGACMDHEYCAKASCAAKAEGHCTPTPSDCGNTKLAVVCGCDGVTYHDACLLHLARQNSSALDNGACSKAVDTTVTCTELDAQKCTGLGGVCGFKAENACIAVGPGNTGTCWVLPASCPGSDDKVAQVCAVESTGCASECDAIKSGQRYALPAQCN